jgi:hypothetical protein
MIRGFFKAACGAMRQADGALSKEMTAYKSRITDLIFVFPRAIPIILPPGGELGVLERSLRAETPQGPRVTVVSSETVPVGSTVEFSVGSLSKRVGKGDSTLVVVDLVREWLDYGKLSGLGQWRSASWGRFDYELEELVAQRATEK